jgi:hypothetical protein
MVSSASRLKNFQLALLPATTHADRATLLDGTAAHSRGADDRQEPGRALAGI